MFCPKCGNEVQEGSAFCGNCGAGIAGKAPNAAGAATATAAVATTKAGKKKGPIAIVAAIVVVAIAAVIGVNVLGGVPVKDSTEAYTWDELSRISDEIGKASDESAAVEIAKKYNLTTKDGKLDGTQTKSVTLTDGTRTAVQIVGFAHDEKTDGGKAGITFIFKDCIGEGKMNPSNTNAGGWDKSQMRSYLNSEGLNLLPSDLKQKVVSVKKLTNNVGVTESTSSVTATSDQLWLFSVVELAGYVSQSKFIQGYGYAADIFNSEGVGYKLFSDMNVNSSGSNDTLVKNYQGSSSSWWERSPSPYRSDFFASVRYDGDTYDGRFAGISLGVVPGFCI